MATIAPQPRVGIPNVPNMPSVRAMITRQKSLARLGVWALDAGAFGLPSGLPVAEPAPEKPDSNRCAIGSKVV
jgi:hypothetical protein